VLTGIDSALYRKDEYVDIPYGHYGNSKKLAENYLIDKFNENLIDPTIFRAFWIFGPYNDPSAKEWFTKKRAIIFGDGKNHKNITHTDNIIYAFRLSENEKSTYGKKYWLGEDENYTQLKLHKLIAEYYGISFNPIFIPNYVCSMTRSFNKILGKFGFQIWPFDAISKMNLSLNFNNDEIKKDIQYKNVVTLENDVNKYF
jgi:nucleoside-diphosphate-sugar epimerase